MKARWGVMRLWGLWLVLVAWFGASLAQGCLPTIEPVCSATKSCPKGYICRTNKCIPGCDADTQCARGETCNQNTCTKSGDEQGADTPMQSTEHPTPSDGGLREQTPETTPKEKRPRESSPERRAPDAPDVGQAPDASKPDTTPDFVPDDAGGSGELVADAQDASTPDLAGEPVTDNAATADNAGGELPNEMIAEQSPPPERVPEVKPACRAPASRVCGTPVGICKARVQRCTAQGEWGPCVWPSPPGQELCANNKDDDCDGYVDEGCVLPKYALAQTITRAHVLKDNTTLVRVSALAWSRDGLTLASLSLDTREMLPVRLWKPMQKAPGTTMKLAVTSAAQALAYDPLGGRLAVGLRDGQTLLWTPGAASPPLVLRGAGSDIDALSFRRDGACLAAAYSASVRVWDVHRRTASYSSPINSPSGLHYHPDGTRLLVSTDGKQGELYMWSLRAGKVSSTTLRSAGADIPQAVFSGAGDAVGAALRASTSNVMTWTLGAGGHKPLAAWKHFRTGVAPGTIAWHPHASLVVVGGQGTYITLWDPTKATSGTAHQEIKVDPYTKGTEKIAFRPDGQALAAALTNGSIAVYGVPCQPGTAARSCYTHGPRTSGVGGCRPGRQICALGPDGKASFWGPCKGEILPTPEVMDGKDNDCDGLIDEGAAVCR